MRISASFWATDEHDLAVSVEAMKRAPAGV